MTEIVEYRQFSHPQEKIAKGKTHGVGPFKKWARGLLEATREGIRESSSADSFGILANEQFQRYFQLQDSEPLDHFTDRLHSNARDMNASWAFCTYVTLVNLRENEAPEPDWDGTNLEQVITRIVSGFVTPAVVWSAHMRPTGDVREAFRHNPSRQGVIFTARDEEVKDTADGTDIFKRVLL